MGRRYHTGPWQFKSAKRARQSEIDDQRHHREIQHARPEGASTSPRRWSSLTQTEVENSAAYASTFIIAIRRACLHRLHGEYFTTAGDRQYEVSFINKIRVCWRLFNDVSQSGQVCHQPANHSERGAHHKS